MKSLKEQTVQIKPLAHVSLLRN